MCEWVCVWRVCVFFECFDKDDEIGTHAHTFISIQDCQYIKRCRGCLSVWSQQKNFGFKTNCVLFVSNMFLGIFSVWLDNGSIFFFYCDSLVCYILFYKWKLNKYLFYYSFLDLLQWINILAQSSEAVEYTDCFVVIPQPHRVSWKWH